MVLKGVIISWDDKQLALRSYEHGGADHEKKLQIEDDHSITDAVAIHSREIPVLDDPSLFPEGGRKAYMVLFGSFCGMVSCLAFLNSAGVMQNYLVEHILTTTPTSTIGWIFSINSFIQFGCLLVVGPIFDRLGAKIPLMAGICLFAIGYLCCSWATKPYQFILSYSIVGGLGASLIFCCNIGVLSHWFLKRRGQAIGTSYLGGALGGALFPVMYRSLFPQIGFGWTVRVGTFICLALSVVSLLLIEDRNSVFARASTNESVFMEVIKTIDIRVFKDKVYTCLVLSLLGQGFAFMVTSTYVTSYSTAQGFSPDKSYLLILTFNSLSIPGRILPGILADKYGRFNMLCIICSCSTITIFVLWLNTKVSHTLVGLFIFSGVYGFTSGSTLSLAPTCVGQISKTQDFAKRTGTAFFVFSFGDLIGIPIGGAIAGANTSKSYDNMVIFVAISSIFGTCGAFLSRYLYAGFKPVRV
ncbi:hypothetical protein PSN45_005038 [Yamadazyma tenuis]|uniref:uncharacterized protein n=1 Tax=Candida tenuis TaxID=2315449 RepID=UPI0027A4240A|nr:hypothetical protein PSN45_005038 [Yamadazyma tenuis]